MWRNVAALPGETLPCGGLSSVGRALQVLGLVLLPMGLLHGLEGGQNAMTLELGFLGAGAAVFLLGTKLQRRGGS
jgi:hypothetical protein